MSTTRTCRKPWDLFLLLFAQLVSKCIRGRVVGFSDGFSVFLYVSASPSPCLLDVPCSCLCVFASDTRGQKARAQTVDEHTCM